MRLFLFRQTGGGTTTGARQGDRAGQPGRNPTLWLGEIMITSGHHLTLTSSQVVIRGRLAERDGEWHGEGETDQQTEEGE